MSSPNLSAVRLPLFSLVAGLLAGSVAADPLPVVFLPPEVEPQMLCAQEMPPLEKPTTTEEENDLSFLPFLRRDIRDLSAEDPVRWYDFLVTLIEWQAELDPGFAGAGEALALAKLQVEAGRSEELRASGLLDRLRAEEWPLTDGMKMALSRYYLHGLGTQQDVPFGQSLIREAAYGGSPEALLAVAAMAARGEPMPDWQAPMDLTVTLAFGGLLGPMDTGICRRAERIAGFFLDGEVVAADPAVALAWYQFAADLGSSEASWRVVEAALARRSGAPPAEDIERYLALAAREGFVPNEEQLAALRVAGLVEPAERTGEGQGRAAALFRLDIQPDAEEMDEDGPYLRYLRELTRFDTTPGWVFTRLANETLVREGRWAGEAEAMALLEEAVQRGDAEGRRSLARMLVRYRDDPIRLERAADLLVEAAELFGLSEAMHDLDVLHRCQAPDAPRLAEAEHWAAAWRAADAQSADISVEDTVALDPREDPWIAARLQTQALEGDPQALARVLERLERDPATADGTLRLWTERVQESDKALELFAVFQFFLARSPDERDEAIELFRRVYSNNGVTTALDFAVALIDDHGRDPAVAREVEELLTQAGNRGEGAAMRLLSRLQAGQRSEAEVFAQFASVIEERGDFLALMFAVPHLSYAQAEDYMDRAVSLMTCGTKDADELGDAFAILQDSARSDQWRRIGLTFEGGHTLSRLDLHNRQVAAFGDGTAPSEGEVLERQLAEGEAGAWQALWALTSDPASDSYDPETAATHLLAALREGRADEGWILRSWRQAVPEVQDAVTARMDLRVLLERAAQRGDAEAALDLGLLLRDRAAGPGDLASALHWLQASAERGNRKAMSELGRLLAAGLAGPTQREEALRWLDEAGRTGDQEAGQLARLLRLSP